MSDTTTPTGADGLPPLPKMMPQPNAATDGDSVQWYTSDQMRAYARAALSSVAGGEREGAKATTVPREPAPPSSLPDWGECQLRCANSDYVAKRRAEGGHGEEPGGRYANELHRFIYEYDDADPYRSGWFMHRLEKLIEFIRAEATRPAAAGVGEDWVLVPRKVNHAMLVAFWTDGDDVAIDESLLTEGDLRKLQGVWDALLAAAPSPGAGGKKADG